MIPEAEPRGRRWGTGDAIARGAGEAGGAEGRSPLWPRPAPRPGRPNALEAPATTRGSSGRDETDSPTAFWALVAFTAVLLLAPQTYSRALAAVPLAKIAAGTAVLAHILARVSRGRPILQWSTELKFAALLLGWSLVTIPVAVWPGGAFTTLQDLYLKSLVIFWILGDVAASMSRLRQIFWSLFLFTLPLPLTAIVRFRSGEFMEGSSGVTRIFGYQAPLTENPNDLALVLNLVLPLVIALAVTTRRPMLRMVLITAAFLDILGVLLTFSRGAFVTLAAVAAVYFVRSLRRPSRRRWALVAMLAAVLSLALMPDSYWARLATIFNVDQDVTGSAQARRIQTYAAMAYSLRHPLVGAGLGQSALALSNLGGTWHIVHNVWLEYSVDLGLPGLALFALLFASSLRTVRNARRAATGRPELSTLVPFAEALELSLLAFGVSTVFHPVAYHFYFYYFAGLAVAVGRIAATSTARATGNVGHADAGSKPLARLRGARAGLVSPALPSDSGAGR